MKLLLALATVAVVRGGITSGQIKYGGDESKNLCLDLPGGSTKDGTLFWVW